VVVNVSLALMLRLEALVRSMRVGQAGVIVLVGM
jgi:hypothetical protein